MYVHRVILENIRPFERLDFSFERPDVDDIEAHYRGWNVIAGDNASGKSTLLRAVALALVGPDIARTLQPSLAGWIRRGAESGMIAVEIVPTGADRFRGGGQRPKPTFFAELQLKAVGPEVTLEAGYTQGERKKSALNGPWAAQQGAWFSAAYGPFRRLYGSSPDAARLMATPGRSPRFATLFKEDATLGEAQEWLQELRFKQLEDKGQEGGLLKSVLALLNDDFLRSGLQVAEVNSSGLWLHSGEGTLSLPLSEMSDGYRSALALLIDLVRHIATVHGPEGLIERRNGKIVVPHAGVVLIDEVDAHLHPEWQRHIGFWFKERFPNIQFIVTSHSPFVAQASDEGGLFALPAPNSGDSPLRLGSEEWRRVIAATPDTILRTSAFGLRHTRSPKAVESRNEYSRLAARRDTGKLRPEEEARMRQLELFAREEES